MMFFFNLLLSALSISAVTWLAKTNTTMAGYLMALPISSMITLVLTQANYQDSAKSVELAQSIFAAIPLSLLFFVPFLMATRLGWPFWALYGSGMALLAVGYFIHTTVLG